MLEMDDVMYSYNVYPPDTPIIIVIYSTKPNTLSFSSIIYATLNTR